MKQLFIDLLTKCVPDEIGYGYMHYTIDRPEHKDDVEITWNNVDSKFNVKTELILPFQHYEMYLSGDKRMFSLYINSFRYDIELNPVETNEVEHLIYQVFQRHQINTINSIKKYINKESIPTPKTTEQQFEAAQEAVAENVSE